MLITLSIKCLGNLIAILTTDEILVERAQKKGHSPFLIVYLKTYLDMA